MAAPGTVRIVSEAARRPAIEWLWGSLGIGIATMSTAFAAYMMAFGPVQPNPQDGTDFGVFAHVRPRTHAAWAATAPLPSRTQDPDRDGAAQDAPPGQDARAEVDFTPTGSVPVGQRRDPPTTLPIGKAAAAAQPPAALPSFTVRDVFDGKALVDSGRALSLVAPGSVLDGAGEVLSIEKRGNGWVVMTTRGLIGAR